MLQTLSNQDKARHHESACKKHRLKPSLGHEHALMPSNVLHSDPVVGEMPKHFANEHTDDGRKKEEPYGVLTKPVSSSLRRSGKENRGRLIDPNSPHEAHQTVSNISCARSKGRMMATN